MPLKVIELSLKIAAEQPESISCLQFGLDLNWCYFWVYIRKCISLRMLPEIWKAVRSGWPDCQHLLTAYCAREKKSPTMEILEKETVGFFLGLPHGNVPCGELPTELLKKKQCFRCNTYSVMRLKEEGCSSSDVSLRKQEGEQNTCFLSFGPVPHSSKGLWQEATSTFPAQFPFFQPAELHQMWSFARALTFSTKCCHLICTVTQSQMCHKYEIKPS